VCELRIYLKLFILAPVEDDVYMLHRMYLLSRWQQTSKNSENSSIAKFHSCCFDIFIIIW